MTMLNGCDFEAENSSHHRSGFGLEMFHRTNFCECSLVWHLLVYAVLRAFRFQAFKHHLGIRAVVDAILIYARLSGRETDYSMLSKLVWIVDNAHILEMLS